MQNLSNRRLRRLEAARVTPVHISTASISNPPTTAQLNAAFGSGLYDGFVGLVDSGGAGTSVALVIQYNGSWYFEALTKTS